jgi:tRNA(Arg) A34 adenosine deaminase TadA
MQAAAEMRRISIATGDQAYGAIIVMAGRIVGLGVSKVVVNRDPTAHAEMEAIRDACRRLGTADLSGSTMFSTSRACCMCETAAAYARVSRMVYGAGLTDAGAPRTCGS